MKCDVDIRKDLYANVVLSGGTTMFPGTMAARFCVRIAGVVEGSASASRKTNQSGIVRSEQHNVCYIPNCICSSLFHMHAAE